MEFLRVQSNVNSILFLTNTLQKNPTSDSSWIETASMIKISSSFPLKSLEVRSGLSFHKHIYVYICIYIHIYTFSQSEWKEKKTWHMNGTIFFPPAKHLFCHNCIWCFKSYFLRLLLTQLHCHYCNRTLNGYCTSGLEFSLSLSQSRLTNS